MIRLRRTLERGRAHPILGPILLIVLVLVLAMVFMHGAHDGHDAVTDIGMVCVGLVTFLGVLLIERLRRQAPVPTIPVRGDRAPPFLLHTLVPQRAVGRSAAFVIPLRR